MKPLIFLYVRSIINGIKRAVSSSRRLIGLLFFFGYYLWIFRPFWRGDSRATALPPDIFGTEFPPLQVIDALVFAGFCAVSLFFYLGIFNNKGMFKPPDVDVLFPTPISPRLVLGFRVARDSLLTLIVPFFLLLFARPMTTAFYGLFKQLPNPAMAAYFNRAAFGGWLLLSIAFTTISISASLYYNRPTKEMDRVRRVLNWTLVLVLAIIAMYAARLVVNVGALGAARDPILRGIMFLSTAATRVAMAPLEGSWAGAILGSGILITFAGLGLWTAMNQSGWFYEQAALVADTFAKIRTQARSGDVYGQLGSMARAGKFKAKGKAWYTRIETTGIRALLWKEAALQTRLRSATVVFVLFVGLISWASIMVVRSSMKDPAPAFLGFQALNAFMVSTGSQMAFLEMLRRVDLQKPLPFTPSKIVFVEVLGRSLVGAGLVVLSGLALIPFMPRLWLVGIASAIAMPTLVVLLCSVYCLITIMFPDVDDPTQRGFRSLMTILSLVLFCGPPVGLFIALMGFLHLPAVVAAMIVAAVTIGIAYFACTIAGNFYASFNPSE